MAAGGKPIVIRREQLAAVERSSFEQTCDWIVAILRDTYADSRSAPEAELSEGVSQQMERAASFGLERDDHMAIYVVTSWVFGDGFPDHFAAAGAVLQADDMTADQKVGWLEEWATRMLQALEGEASCPSGEA